MEDYVRVNRETVEAIREIDPDRLIILEGLNGANTPCEAFVPSSTLAKNETLIMNGLQT
jgi:hypothetical protein